MRAPWWALFEFRLRSIFKHQEVRLKSSSWKRSGRPLGTARRMAALWGSFSHPPTPLHTVPCDPSCRTCMFCNMIACFAS